MADLSLAAAVTEIKANPGKFYVYVLMRPNNVPFYVGVGSSRLNGRQRIQDHANDAKRKGKSWKGIVIRSIWDKGLDVLYRIDGWHSTRESVFAREVYLIDLLGRLDLGGGPLVNGNDGGTGQFNPSAEIRARISATKRAQFASDPDASAKASARAKEIMRRPGMKERLSTALKRHFSIPGASAAVSAQNYRRFSDPAARTAASDRARKQNATAEAKAAFVERMTKVRPQALRLALEAKRSDPTYRSRMSAIKKQQAIIKSEIRSRIIIAAANCGVGRDDLPANRSALAIWLALGKRYGIEA